MQIPNLPRTQKTLLEIMKVHNKEVPMANLLAFLFNPKEAHNLGTLFIEALLETVCYELNKTRSENGQLYKNGYKLDATTLKVLPDTDSKYSLPNSFGSKIKVEKGEGRKRIDLFITNEAEKFAIVIEFKINHSLNNPLEIYKRSVEKKEFQEHQLFFVVLTPNKKEAGFNNKEIIQFKQVVLSDLIETIKSKLSYADFIDLNQNNIYFQYYLQFINTIENRKKNKEIRELISKHKLTVELLKEKTELNKKWKAELSKVDKEIEQKLTRLKRKLKQNNFLVNSGIKNGTNENFPRPQGIPFNKYIEVKQVQTTIKIRLTLKEWTIEKWQNIDGKNHKLTEGNSFDYTTSTDEILKEVKAFVSATSISNPINLIPV